MSNQSIEALRVARASRPCARLSTDEMVNLKWVIGAMYFAPAALVVAPGNN
jgi:hypothetical protein